MSSLFNNTAFKYGFISCAIYILAYVIMWQVDLALFLSPWVTYPLAISVFVFAVIGQVKEKQKLGGHISFSKALVNYIISTAIGFAGALIAGILIFNIIDPEAKDILFELTVDMAMEMTNRVMGWFGVEPGATSLSQDQMRASMSTGMQPFGIASLVIGYFTNVALYIIGGLISSLIIKNEKPYEFE